MAEPLISVIIPVYKTEAYLEKCVKSVMAQTYRNLEIILVDDGSPDNCPQLCERLAKQDARITVIHQENAGVGAARNHGLDVCRGAYVSFVDSDDYVHPAFIETMYKALAKYGTDIAVCGIVKTSSRQAHPLKKTAKRGVKVTVASGVDAGLMIVDDKVIYKKFVVCNKLFKRSLFERIRFSDRKISEDFDVSYRAFFASDKVVILDKILYYYYMNQNSAVHIHEDNLHTYINEVFDGYDEMCALYIDRDRLQQVKRATHIKRMDYALEDYFSAFMNHHGQRMKSAHRDYEGLKRKAARMHIPLKLKFRLFEISPALFLAARWGYEIVDLFKIK